MTLLDASSFSRILWPVSVIFLIHILRVLVLHVGRHSTLLVFEVPVIQIASAGRYVRSKRKPGHVWCEEEAGNLIYLAPDVSHVPGNTSESNDIDRCLDGSLPAKEERHKKEVEAKLYTVECGSVLGEETRSWA